MGDTFLHHAECHDSECGSSDGMAVYAREEDGSLKGYCFVCETSFPRLDGEVAPSAPPKTDRDSQFLNNLEIKPLSARKISDETCQKYGYALGKMCGSNCQVAEYFKDGVLTAQHIRFPDKSFSWIGSPSNVELYGQRLCRTKDGKRIIITEGEIDCLTVSQVLGNKWQVVSIPNGAQSAKKAIKNNLEFLESYQEVIFCFDQDEAGRKAVLECAAIISPGKAKIVELAGFKDPNEMLQKGKTKELVSALWEAKTFRPDGIINGTELRASLKERFLQGVIRGFSLPYPELDDITHGAHKGKLYTLTAGSGIGKSTMAHEIAHHLNKVHGQSIGIVALEENLEQSSMKQIGITLNKPLHIDMEGITEEQWDDAYDSTIGNGRTFLYDHFGSLECDNLLAKLRYLVVGCGVDFIILDHISIVVSGTDDGDERKAIDVLMTNLRSLVEETGVGMFVISHLKRPEGKSHEEGGRVTLGQLRGSASIAQLSDFVLGLERDQQGEDPDVTGFRCLKNRYTGKVGMAGYVKYIHPTGRLLPHTLGEDSHGFDDVNPKGDF